MAVSIYDRWHRRPKPGDAKCKEHKLVPSSVHNTGERWQVRWDVWVDGKRQQPKRNFKYKIGDDPEKHADAFVIKLQAELSAPPPDPKAEITVRAVSEEWLSLQTFTDSTETTTLSRIRNHITMDGFGDSLVFDLCMDPNLIQLWIKELGAKGLAPTTIRLTAGYLTSILEYARFKGMVSDNPLRPVSPLIKFPRVPEKKVIPYTRQQLKDIENNLLQVYEIIPKAGSRLGLRIGEIRGLSPDDIDGDEIHIRRQVKYNRKRRCLVYDLPKGEKTRVVPLVPSVKDFLISLPAHTVTLPWKSPDNESRKVRLYAVTYGKPWAYETLHDHWAKVHERLGIVRLPREDAFHRLRHTFASKVLHAGIDIRTLSEWLGHRNTAFTLKTYCHFIPSDPSALRKAIDG